MDSLLNEELMLSTPTPEELGLTFREEPNGDFWVTYKPSGLTLPLEADQFPHVMLFAGYSINEYPVDSVNLSILLDSIRRGKSIDMRLGGPIDARTEVYISTNQMLAGVIVYPAQGKGKNLNREMLNTALKQSKVVRGLLDESLDELTNPSTQKTLRETTQPICMVIAYGESAYNGKDAWLETLLDEIADRRPVMDDAGHIDFLELGNFPHVNADQALVRRHPPTEGKSGWTVTGKTVKSRNGKDFSLKASNASVKLAPSDNDLLLSAVSGMPVVLEKGAHVEQTLKVEEVGLKTGHIRFDGSVHIKGNVNPGMKIEVSGDVKVGGIVEAAYIKAGGMIEVGGGIIGRKHNEQDRKNETLEGKVKVDDAYIEAGSIVKARFIQEAKVIAGQEVIVQKQILHSHVKAGIKVHLPGKGAIVGGITEAKQLIDVAISGAPANVITRLQVGNTSEVRSKITTINNQLKQLEIQKQQLMELINKIKQQRKPVTEEKKQQILTARDTLKVKEEQAYDELKQLEEQLKELQTARVQVRKTCHPGSQIEIEEGSFSPRNDLGKATFFLRDGEVHMR
ncbi:MAG TPA: FapA family protein [Marinospirillum sp.]|uniref:FapA family protein n=1 Tax=Marinospirillum sp. TaxID=2183934 RepID=UPI002B47AD5A|nr:FapA family protein [Marinospirillum sp.]HKM15578.1 FapA family protein [Marinospirillum sp.]